MHPISFDYELGQRVILTDLERPGRIISCSASQFNGIQYQVVYWYEGVRRCEWLYHYEISKEK